MPIRLSSRGISLRKIVNSDRTLRSRADAVIQDINDLIDLAKEICANERGAPSIAKINKVISAIQYSAHKLTQRLTLLERELIDYLDVQSIAPRQRRFVEASNDLKAAVQTTSRDLRSAVNRGLDDLMIAVETYVDNVDKHQQYAERKTPVVGESGGRRLRPPIGRPGRKGPVVVASHLVWVLLHHGKLPSRSGVTLRLLAFILNESGWSGGSSREYLKQVDIESQAELLGSSGQYKKGRKSKKK